MSVPRSAPLDVGLVAFGLRLRLDAVAHFLGETRRSSDRSTLSALAFHAGSLRRYADAAPARLRSHLTGGPPNG